MIILTLVKTRFETQILIYKINLFTINVNIKSQDTRHNIQLFENDRKYVILNITKCTYT